MLQPVLVHVDYFCTTAVRALNTAVAGVMFLLFDRVCVVATAALFSLAGIDSQRGYPSAFVLVAWVRLTGVVTLPYDVRSTPIETFAGVFHAGYCRHHQTYGSWDGGICV